MKKFLSVILVICIGMSLTACGSKVSNDTPQAPVYKIEEGAYSCTPQEFIDYVNDGLQDEGFIEIPAYEESGEEIKIAGARLTLKLTENADGKLKKVRLYWFSDSSEDIMSNAGFIFGMITSAFSPTNSDIIFNGVKSASADGTEYAAEFDGTVFDFDAFGSGGNGLDVYPKT